MSQTIWIDITDMLSWKGQFGGTQRVVYGIAREFLADSEQDVQFVRFDTHKKAFMVASFEPIQKHHDAILEATKAERYAQARSIGPLERTKRVAYRLAPRFVKTNPALKQGLKNLAKNAYTGLNRASSMLRTVVASPHRSAGGAVALMKSGDVLLLLGKPWDTPSMMPFVVTQKSLGVRVVTVIYDLVISLYPHLHTTLLFKDYTQYLYHTAQASELVLPISESSRRDYEIFCRRLMLPMPKAHVIRLGEEVSVAAKSSIPRGYEAYKKEDFILCVGTVEVRKNHALLYSVYKLAKERGMVLPRLVIVGKLGWGTDDIYHTIKTDPEIDNFTILSHVHDDELEWLYKNCLFAVYPSLYEGWGLPVAEALQHGKVVVSSNASSLPEIAGDLIEYHSPYSADECLALIGKYLNRKTRLAAEQRIAKLYKVTSWAETYKQVKDAINNMERM